MKRWVNISDAVEITNNRVKLFKGERRYLATGDLIGDAVNESIVSVDYENKPSRADLLVDEGNIIVARMQATNKVLLIDKSTEDLIVSTGFLTLQPQKDFDGSYLAHYFQSDVFQKQKDKYCSGATQKAINNGAFGKLQVPSYPLDEQKRIANILDHADALRQKRKEALKLLGESLRATFYEMFGNPIDNPRRWDIKAVGEVLQEIQGGESPVCEGVPRSSLSQRAILKLGAVTSCYYRPEENKALAESFILGRTVEALPGMVLFSRKNTYELVGASVYIFSTPPKLLLPDTIFNLVYKKEEITGQYLWMLFIDSGFKKKIQNLASGTSGSMPNISMKRLMALEIPLPSIDLQKKFSAFVDQVEELRQEMKRSLFEMDNQFNALVQKYFT